MITRVDIVNHLLRKIKGQYYLEVGSGYHDSFNEIICRSKHDIEPNPGPALEPTYRMTSDEAFARMGKEKYDVIMIDGMHLCDQVAKDVYNACRHLNPNGYVVLHDCLPDKEVEQQRTPPGGNWTGDVWKFQAWMVKHFENVWTISENWGCGIIKGSHEFEVPTLQEMSALTWQNYVENRNELLRIVDWNTFKESLL